MTERARSRMRSASALLLALALAAPAARAAGVAAPGPCAVAPEREPCAGGACAKSRATLRDRFDPTDVSAGAAPAMREAPLPNPNAFTGPGTCADPSAGCGAPRTEPVVAGGPRPPAGLPPAPPTVIEQPPVSEPPPP